MKKPQFIKTKPNGDLVILEESGVIREVYLGNESSHRIIKKQFLVINSGETEYVTRRDYYIDNTIKSMSSDDNNNIVVASNNKIQRISNTTGGELVSITNNVGSNSNKAPTNLFLEKNADNIFMINDGNLSYLTPSDTKLISVWSCLRYTKGN